MTTNNMKETNKRTSAVEAPITRLVLTVALLVAAIVGSAHTAYQGYARSTTIQLVTNIIGRFVELCDGDKPVSIESGELEDYIIWRNSWRVFQVFGASTQCDCTADCPDEENSIFLFMSFSEPTLTTTWDGWVCSATSAAPRQSCVAASGGAGSCYAAVYADKPDSNHEPCQILCVTS